MTRRSSAAVLRQIHTLFTAGSFNGLSDRQLLDRFVVRRDAVAELAFATLVERHGPMVLGVCRRILADSHDAEDAFQATFLVLVRQAGSIRVDGSLGRWLYGVATRVASRARANARRREARERTGLDRIDAESRETSTGRAEVGDVQSILAEELGKLPARFQAPVVLCDLQGSSHEEAAQLLGCPVGTIKSRLSRARTRLRRGLIRRGLAPPDVSNSVRFLPVTLPRRLVEVTSQAAQTLISGRPSTGQVISASVAALAEGALRTMFLTKLKAMAATLFLIITGSAVLVSQATAQRLGASTEIQDNRAAPATVANEAATRDDEVELIMLEHAWADAIPRRDVAVVRRILADDFEGIEPLGHAFTKVAYLSDLRAGIFSLQPIVLDEIKARVFGDFAVVTSQTTIRDVVPLARMSHIYVKRQGRWFCLAAHGSWTGTSRASAGNLLQVHGMLKYINGQIKTNDPSAQRRFAALQSKVTLRPHFECRIARIYVRPGESVKKGDRLAEIFSTELAAHKKAYRTKKVRWEHDRTRLQSRQRLVESKTVSEQLLSEAQNDESRSLFEFQIAEGKLKLLGLDDEVIRRVEKEEGDQLFRLTLRSPIDGTVLEVGAEVGSLYDSKRDLMLIAPYRP